MSKGPSPRLRELAAGASLEVTPKNARRIDEWGGMLPAGTSVYVTSLPGADPFALVPAAVAIRDAGHVPVPHLAARSIAGRDQLDALLGRLTAEAGVDDVLVIAGGVKEPVGALSASMEILESGLLERHGIRRAGVAGHPEGSPDIPADAEREALAAKNAFAARSDIDLRLVTQFALAPEPYVAWERRIRAEGNRLPVVAGIPGVTSPPALLRYAVACGVGPSLEVLRKQTGGLVKLAATREWRPSRLAQGIAYWAEADPDSRFSGLHLYPFGGVEASAGWLALARGAPAPVPV